jgi:hypothetical protein
MLHISREEKMVSYIQGLNKQNDFRLVNSNLEVRTTHSLIENELQPGTFS